MSFRVYVTLPHKPFPMPEAEASREVWDKWINEEYKFTIYDEPLGGDSAVYHFWHAIAISLHLPMMANLYERGLQIRGTDELLALEKELDLLAQYWKTHKLEDTSKVDPWSHEELMEHLWERMDNIRKAIQRARDNDAELSVH